MDSFVMIDFDNVVRNHENMNELTYCFDLLLSSNDRNFVLCNLFIPSNICLHLNNNIH